MRSRWLVIGLVVSLALNLFLMGAAAAVIGFGLGLSHQAGGRPAAILWASRRLSGPARRELRGELQETRARVRPQVEQSLALRLQAWGALAAPAPDAAAVKQTLAQSRQIDIGVRTEVENQIVDDALRLDPKDRAVFAEGVQKALQPRRTHRPRAR